MVNVVIIWFRIIVSEDGTWSRYFPAPVRNLMNRYTNHSKYYVYIDLVFIVRCYCKAGEQSFVVTIQSVYFSCHSGNCLNSISCKQQSLHISVHYFLFLCHLLPKASVPPVVGADIFTWYFSLWDLYVNFLPQIWLPQMSSCWCSWAPEQLPYHLGTYVLCTCCPSLEISYFESVCSPKGKEAILSVIHLSQDVVISDDLERFHQSSYYESLLFLI